MLLTRVATVSRRMMIFSSWSNGWKVPWAVIVPKENLFLFIQTLRLLLQRPISNPISLIGNMCFSNEAEKTNKNVASLKERAACCICMHRRCHGRQTISAALCDAVCISGSTIVIGVARAVCESWRNVHTQLLEWKWISGIQRLEVPHGTQTSWCVNTLWIQTPNWKQQLEECIKLLHYWALQIDSF